MIIIPEKSPESTDPELLPIKMILETRMDALALFLRVLRYLGQKEVWGPKLVWSDDPESSGIYIAKYSSNSIGKDANPLPAILVGIGGYQTGELFMSHSAVDISPDFGTQKMTKMDTNVSIAVRGQNEQQTYIIADILSAMLDIVRPEVLAAAYNLDSMSGISVGPVNKITDPSGNPYIWECNLGFHISINRFYMTKNYAGKKTPDPAVDSEDKIYLGTAGRVGRKNFKQNKPMLAYADFIATVPGVTDDEGPEVTIYETNIFDGRDG